MVLDALDLFNQQKLGAKPHGNGRPYPMVSGPSLSGGFFDDEQHRFGSNDLLQAPQRTTKPLGCNGWHVDMWAGDQENMLTVMKDSWSHLQQLSKTYCAVCTDAWKIGLNLLRSSSIDVGLMHAYASSHHSHLLPITWKCSSPPKVGIRWPGSQLGRPRGGRNFMAT